MGNGSLNQFIADWQKDYKEKAKKIPLFQENELSSEQVKKFILMFYHARGHFYRFLWHLGSRAPDEKFKKIILGNISEEFGGSKRSHEELYILFAKDFEVDITSEIISEEHNVPFIKGFNNGHIAWLLKHDFKRQWSAFSAYEKLDNIDYENLFRLAVLFGTKGKALTFFEVHRSVEHYEATSEYLQAMWNEDRNAITSAFTFIGNHQLELWSNVSSELGLS